MPGETLLGRDLDGQKKWHASSWARMHFLKVLLLKEGLSLTDLQKCAIEVCYLKDPLLAMRAFVQVAEEPRRGWLVS